MRGLHAASEEGPKHIYDTAPARPRPLEERVAELERRLGAVVEMQDREREKLADFRDAVLSPSDAPERSGRSYSGEEESADVDPRYP